MSIEMIRQQIASGKVKVSVPITVVETGVLGDAEYRIQTGVNPELAVWCDTHWKYFFDSIIDRLKQMPPEKRIQAAQGLQLGGYHWNWFDKSIYFKDESKVWFFILIEQEVQGVCVISHPSGAKLEAGEVFYIEYLSSAPWNTPNPLAPKRYTGIGSTLMQCAINYGVNTLKLKYGFNLHAIRQAEGFYEKIGMKHISEYDKTESTGAVLKFYEITAEATRALIPS